MEVGGAGRACDNSTIALRASCTMRRRSQRSSSTRAALSTVAVTTVAWGALVFSRPIGVAAFVAFPADRLASLSTAAVLSLSASRRGGAMARKKSKRTTRSGGSPSVGFGGGGPAKEIPPSAAEGVEADGDDGAHSIYSLPALYDLAFGYRNYDEEVSFLLKAHARYNAVPDDGDVEIHALELAAGPARHSLAALKSGGIASVTAIDVSDDMVSYGRENADGVLGGGDNPLREKFRYVRGDMRNLEEALKGDGVGCGGEAKNETKTTSSHHPLRYYDTAWLLLGSMQHLLTNNDAIRCLKSVSSALRPGGTLVVELPHPRETFTMVECTRNGWEVPLEDEEGEAYGALKIVWGDDDDPFDPIRQVRDFTVAMDLDAGSQDGKQLQSVREVVPMRLYTAQEVDALGRCGGFELVAMYGALCEEVSVDSEEEAFRLVCVLRHVPDR